MKRKIRSLALQLLCVPCALALATSCGTSAPEREAPPEAPAPPPPPPTLVETSFALENGLRVELLEGPCGDSAAIALLVEAGMDSDPPGRSGMAHLLERLLAPAGRPERRVWAGRDHTVDSVVVAGDRLMGELDAVAARLGRLEVSDAELSAARAAVLDELARRHGGDAALTAASFASESVLPTRGDGWLRGVAAEVETIALPDVEAFHAASFRPGSARLVVAGRFDAVAVRARIETAFAPLAAGTAPTPREPTEASVSGTLVFGDAPAAVAVGVRAPALTDPLYPAFLVLAARLSTSPAEARSWEVSYDPLAAPDMLLFRGPLEIGEAPDAAATRIRNQVAAIVGRPLSPDDAIVARERFALFLGLGALDPEVCAAGPRELAVARARRAQLGLAGTALADALDAVTAAQLSEAALRFSPARMAAVVAGGTIR